MATKKTSAKRTAATAAKSLRRTPAKKTSAKRARAPSVAREAAPVSDMSTGGRLVDGILTNLSAAQGRAKRKVSVTVDADLWDEVSRLVLRDAATTASAAVEGALAMWAANQRLRELLEEIYDESPESRPTEEQVTAAAERLGLA